MRLIAGMLCFGLVGCHLLAPKYTEAEMACMASVEAREDAELAACGKDVSGECSTDAIMDRYDEEAERCLKH